MPKHELSLHDFAIIVAALGHTKDLMHQSEAMLRRLGKNEEAREMGRQESRATDLIRLFQAANTGWLE